MSETPNEMEDNLSMRANPHSIQSEADIVHPVLLPLSLVQSKLQSELEREWLWKRYETLVSESLTAERKKGLAEEMLRDAF